MADADDYSYSPHSGETVPIHNRSSLKKSDGDNNNVITNIINGSSPPTPAKTKRPPTTSNAPSTNASSQTYLLFLATCLFVTMTGNFLHHHIADPHNIHNAQLQFEMQHLGGAHKEIHNELLKKQRKVQQIATSNGLISSEVSTSDTTTNNNKAKVPPLHDLSGLNCADHGGPSNSFAKEMIYWKDIPSDAKFKSPIGNDPKNRQYLTFEPDGGGFNNARMAMETFVVMAHAMGRTLVLPPSQGVYLLRKDRDKQRVHFSYNDFYHMEQVGYEHDGLDIITMEEFLKREAMSGNLKNITSGIAQYPPDNRTNWDGIDPKPLKEYLREVTLTPLGWKDPAVCLAAFPSDDGLQHFDELNEMFDEVKKDKKQWNYFTDKPVAVDASTVDRMKEAASRGIQRLCIYDDVMQAAPVVHFMCYHKMRVRMLTHFYAFLFFEDWKHDLWSKRFVRDHLRYSDEIQCAAARIVEAVRKRAREKDPKGNPNGEFDSFHIRRGDFQYKNTRLEADQIYENVKGDIPDKTTVFVATDHQGKPWFKNLTKHYDMVFLKDFKKELEGVNTNYYGMIDQLVASRGRIFFGCMHSTFSGFIFRIRGYHSQKDQLPGWEAGTLHHSFYYTGKKDKGIYEHYTAVHSPVYAREYPTSWRDIDKGIDMLGANPLLEM